MAKVTPKVVRAIETKLIHAGEPDPLIGGAVAMPIFQSATFAYRGEQNYHDLRYIRLSNTPNHEVLHRKLAALENAEAALVAGSGMAAISTTMLALLGVGDRLLTLRSTAKGELPDPGRGKARLRIRLHGRRDQCHKAHSLRFAVGAAPATRRPRGISVYTHTGHSGVQRFLVHR